jgi:hypothetical protein
MKGRHFDEKGAWKKRLRGRPQKSIEEHTGKTLEELVSEGLVIDEPTYEECAELLKRVYEECGPSKAMYLIDRFECDRLRDMPKRYYPDFIRGARAILEDQKPGS